jgi:NAD(P)-dependent dehydrogenase (short-subunit alcohol dehydrogenase family)
VSERSVALVSGGASGIGAAVAQRLRDTGQGVVVLDIADPCDIRCDVADADAVSNAVQETTERYGVPTRVVACAGIGRSGLLLKERPEEFRRVLDVNLLGTWSVLRAAAACMVAAGVGGSMVAVSSISGSIADRTAGPYCIAKAGVDMLVRVAAVEWGVHGIRVNAVAPGVTRTPMLGDPSQVPGWTEGLTERTPLGRLGEADDVAEVAVALLDLGWVTGEVVRADGGLGLHSPIDSYGTALRARRSVTEDG